MPFHGIGSPNKFSHSLKIEKTFKACPQALHSEYSTIICPSHENPCAVGLSSFLTEVPGLFKTNLIISYGYTGPRTQEWISGVIRLRVPGGCHQRKTQWAGDSASRVAHSRAWQLVLLLAEDVTQFRPNWTSSLDSFECSQDVQS